MKQRPERVEVRRLLDPAEDRCAQVGQSSERLLLAVVLDGHRPAASTLGGCLGCLELPGQVGAELLPLLGRDLASYVVALDPRECVLGPQGLGLGLRQGLARERAV